MRSWAVSLLLLPLGALSASDGGMSVKKSLRVYDGMHWLPALEWIEPMRNAETRASSLMMAAIRGDVDDEHFLTKFPHLLSELVKKDLPPNQRAALPDNIYERGHRIVHDMETLRYFGVKYGQEARVMGKPMAGFQECSNKLDTLGKQISELETDLREAFRRTFE